MKIVIIGSGYTGQRLAARAVNRGHDVVGTSRNDETLAELTSVGAQAARYDVLTAPEAIGEQLEPGASVVYSIPTLFDDPADGEHLAPVRAALEAAAEAECSRFVYLSSTSVYGDYDGETINEDSPRHPTSPVGIMRRDIEDLVLGFDGIDTYIVRIVGIYGPGRTLDRYIARGRYKLVDGGQKRTNRIHVDDLCEVILAVLERASPGHRAYIASDGNPVRVVDLVDWMVEHLGIERPEEVTMEQYEAERGPNAAARWRNSYSASNDRIVEELNVELAYPTVIDGYEAIFRPSL